MDNKEQTPDYRVASTNNMTENAKEMRDTINTTEDLTQRGAIQGEKANKALQNVEIPKSKLATMKDILTSDEFKGQRIPYIVNAIGTGIGNLLSGYSGGKSYDSYLKQHNDAMAQNYRENKAARDTAATKANIEDIEAGNKAEMGKYVQMSDAVVEQALKRYGVLEDTETKKRVLNDVIKQATGKEGGVSTWNSLKDDEKIATMALMQVYNGDYSMASMLMEKYGDDFMNIINRVLTKLGLVDSENPNPLTTGGDNGNDATPPKGPVTNGLGQEFTEEEITNGADNVVAIPTENGVEYIRLPGATDGNNKTVYDYIAKQIISNPNIVGKETWEQDADELMKEIFSQKKGLKVPYVTSQARESIANAIKEKKTADEKAAKDKADAEKKYKDAGTYITNFYQNLKGTPQQKIDKINNDKKLWDAVAIADEGSGNSNTSNKVNGWIETEKANIFDGEYNAIVNNSSWDAGEKLYNLEELSKNNAELIAKNPALQKKIDNQKSVLEVQEKYIEPYDKKMNKYVEDNLNVPSTSGAKGITYTVNNDGTLTRNNGVKAEVVNFSSPRFTKDYSSTAIESYLDFVANNGTLTNVRRMIDPESNLTDKDLAAYFSMSPVYTMLKNIVSNQSIKNMANETKKQKVNGEKVDVPKYENLNMYYASLSEALKNWNELLK